VLFGLLLPLLIRKVHPRLLWYCVVLHTQLNKYHVVYIINYCHKIITQGKIKGKKSVHFAVIKLNYLVPIAQF